VDDGCPPEELADSLVDHVAAAEVSAEAEAVLQPRRLSAALARNTLASGAIMLQAWAHAMHRAAWACSVIGTQFIQEVCLPIWRAKMIYGASRRSGASPGRASGAEHHLGCPSVSASGQECAWTRTRLQLGADIWPPFEEAEDWFLVGEWKRDRWRETRVPGDAILTAYLKDLGCEYSYQHDQTS
jgi:hypothetical protein